jgi:hypothetical protein
MELIADRIEALVVARAAMATSGMTVGELVKPLARFAPAELTPVAWRDRLAAVAGELRRRDLLDEEHRVRAADALEQRLGPTSAKTWAQLADRVLPGLGLGLDADDHKALGRLVGRDAWAAAIAGRALGLWRQGAPLSLAQLCDALAWRELGLAGKPKRCPPEVRAVFVQRRLGSDAGPPERLVRLLAAREVGAPRPELRVLRDALVRGWLAGRTLGPPPDDDGDDDDDDDDDDGEVLFDVSEDYVPVAPGPALAFDADEARSTPTAEAAQLPSSGGDDGPARTFAADVRRAAAAVRDGRFGDRKVFVSAVWDELRTQPRWADLALEDCKARLFAAHCAGELTLARADLVAAMDPALVAASEISVTGASFHFVVQEPST